MKNKFLFVMCLSIMILFSLMIVFPNGSAFDWTDTHIVSYYSFDDSSGNFIDNVSGNNLIMSGTANRVAGKIGKAVEFNDNNLNYLNSTFNVGIVGAMPRSVCFWEKKYTTTNEETSVSWGTSSNYHSFAINYFNGVGTYYQISTYNQDIKSGVVGDTNNNFRCITFNGTQLGYWINGINIYNNTPINPLNTGNSLLTVGKAGNQWDQPFNGIIDELLIYNGTLVGANITSLYNLGAGLTYGNYIASPQVNVSLVSPVNNSNVSVASQDFNCYANSTNQLSNVSLLIWNSTGGLVYNGQMIGIESSVSTGIYQENATSTSYTSGWTNPLNTYDGNWTTFGTGGVTNPVYIYFNYTKPFGAWYHCSGSTGCLFKSKWEVKPNFFIDYNVTGHDFPVYCWYLQDKIQFRIARLDDETFNYSNGSCWDGVYNLWRDITSDINGDGFYEEAMWWNLTNNFTQTYVLPYADNFTWNCNATDVNGLSNWSATNNTLNFAPSINITNYNSYSDVLELSNYVFNVTFKNSGNYSISNVYFVYNGTPYSTGINSTTSGTNITYSKIFNIPFIIYNNLSVNESAYWSFTLSYGGSTVIQNSTIQGIINHQMAINYSNSCAGDYSYALYNISYYDEYFFNRLSFSMNNSWSLVMKNPENPTGGTRIYQNASSSIYTQFCGHYVDNAHPFYISSNFSMIMPVSSAYLYSNRKDYMCLISNTTSLTNKLYFLWSNITTNTFYFNIKNNAQEDIPYAMIYFYKQAVPDNYYVGSILTDQYGDSAISLIPDVNYIIVAKDSSNCAILQTWSVALTCPSLPCTYDLIVSSQLNPLQPTEELAGFTYAFVWNETAKTINLSYDDVSGQVSSVNFDTYYRDLINGDVLVCANVSYSDTDNLVCNVSAYTTGSFISYMIVHETNGKTFTRSYPFDLQPAKAIFHTEGLLWGILIVITLFFAGIWNPVVSIVLAIVGLIALAIIGFVSLPWLFFVLIGVIAIIIIIKLKS